LLSILKDEGFQLTQATLSRDLKQLKVAKAASVTGKYVYVLPNDIMYARNVANTNASQNADVERIHIYTVFGQSGSHQDQARLCEQHGI
jgi:arginine repressor